MTKTQEQSIRELQTARKLLDAAYERLADAVARVAKANDLEKVRANG